MTSAVNCMVPAEAMVTGEGETVTDTAAGLFDDEAGLAVETPAQAERPRRAAAKVTSIAHCDKFAWYKRRLFGAEGSASRDIQSPLEMGFREDAQPLSIPRVNFIYA